MINRLILIGICIAAFSNCGKNGNSEVGAISSGDCPQPDSTQSADVPKVSIGKINVFLETSGSMSGYMPNSQPATEFQKLIPDLVSILNTQYNQTVNFYSIYNSETSFRRLDISDARSKVLRGDFSWSGSTYLPVMLDSINQYLSEDAVNIFITDAIYSPENADQKSTVLAATDIREKIAPYVDSYSLVSFCLLSEFRNRQNKSVKSPYYLFIQGKPENIQDVANRVSETILRNDQSFEDLNLGWRKQTIYYSILPYTETTPNFTAEPCEGYKDAFVRLSNISLQDDSLSFWMGINLNDLPEYVTSESYLKNNLFLSMDRGTSKITAIQKQLPNADQDDKSIARNCTHFIRIRINEMNTPATSLNVSLKYSTPDWVSRFNENNLDKEKDREKTFGLRRIVSGYEQAYLQSDNSYFFKDLTIPLTKE
jgi:hypothetical protein